MTICLARPFLFNNFTNPVKKARLLWGRQAGAHGNGGTMLQTNYIPKIIENQTPVSYELDEALEAAELLAKYWESIAEFCRLRLALESLEGNQP